MPEISLCASLAYLKHVATLFLSYWTGSFSILAKTLSAYRGNIWFLHVYEGLYYHAVMKISQTFPEIRIFALRMTF